MNVNAWLLPEPRESHFEEWCRSSCEATSLEYFRGNNRNPLFHLRRTKSTRPAAKQLSVSVLLLEAGETVATFADRFKKVRESRRFLLPAPGQLVSLVNLLFCEQCWSSWLLSEVGDVRDFNAKFSITGWETFGRTHTITISCNWRVY